MFLNFITPECYAMFNMKSVSSLILNLIGIFLIVSKIFFNKFIEINDETIMLRAVHRLIA